MAKHPRNVEVDTDDCLKDYKYAFQKDILQGQVAFVTGGGSGIGFRIVEILMRHGCDAAIASRKLEKVQKAAEKLERATGRRCLALRADVRNPKEIEQAVDDILSYYGRIDILVNSAAGNFLCDAENLSYNAFKTVLEIDTMGTFNTCKAVYQKYFKNHGGKIVNISATLPYKGNIFQVHAGSAKAAIDAMARHMAVEWGSSGVRVNNVAPGPIMGTEGMRRLGGNSPMVQQMSMGIPLQRMGQKCEIAEAVLYLSSDTSSYVTGAVLVVDGGDWMTSYNNLSIKKQLLVKSKI